MGIVRSIQKGEQPASKFSKSAQKAAKKMKKSSVKKYAKTKHDDLPTKKESTSAYKKSLEKIAKDKQLKMLSKKDKETLIKIAKMMKEGRDYKDEYKKFQSSTRAKKYRAELNKYNRQKGTYGNGDGKDASHKGGKIVGFESQSKNRGRAEKSRLKKEINDYVGGVLDEVVNEAGMELKKLEDAIKMFKKKIEKQGRVTNARDEEHLERLMKVYNDMGGRKIKENSESLNWLQEKCWKGYEKKGMKTMFGKRYPNCVKKKKSESVDEGTCGYGIDGKIGEEPAGPNLMKKIKKISKDKEKKKILKSRVKEVKPVKLKGKSGMGTISHVGMPKASKGVEKLFKIADSGYGKVGGVTVDGMSANLFKQIYNKANDDIKKKLNTKNEKQLVRILGGMWKKFGKNVSIGSSL